MEKEDLKERTIQFSVRIVKLTGYLSESPDTDFLAREVFLAGTGVAIKYRWAACAEIQSEFNERMKPAVETTHATLFWLELLMECNFVKPEKIENLHREAEELLQIFAASQKTAKKNTKKVTS